MQEPDKAHMRLADSCGKAVQPGRVCLHQAPAQSMLLMHWSWAQAGEPSQARQ